MMQYIRRYFIAGMLLWLPVWVTLLIIRFIVDLFDSSVSLLPSAYRPDHFLGIHVPGFGVIISLVIVLLTGMLVTNFLGRWLVNLGESIVARIPFVRSIYAGSKQIFETLLSSTGQSFKKVYLVEYPRKGLWSIAFQTGQCVDEIADHLGEPMLNIFIPTTPNPTAGFLMMIPRQDALELDISVEQALKLVISMGVIQPQSENQKVKNNILSNIQEADQATE